MSQLKSREGAAAIAEELLRLSPAVTSRIGEIRRFAFASGRIPSKHKLLTAVALSIAIRCEPCLRAYVEWAGRMGATKEELVEFLNVAMAMQGCPGEEWSLKALAAYHELVEGRSASPEADTAGDVCCAH